jgi:hypothetical protein
LFAPFQPPSSLKIIRDANPISHCIGQRNCTGHLFIRTYAAGPGTSEPFSLTQEAVTTAIACSETDAPAHTGDEGGIQFGPARLIHTTRPLVLDSRVVVHHRTIDLYRTALCSLAHTNCSSANATNGVPEPPSSTIVHVASVDYSDGATTGYSDWADSREYNLVP